MRCIALAQAWQGHGGEVTFFSHCESTALRERIIEEGFGFVPIEHLHPHPDDLSQTLEFLNHSSLITRHYLGLFSTAITLPLTTRKLSVTQESISSSLTI